MGDSSVRANQWHGYLDVHGANPTNLRDPPLGLQPFDVMLQVQPHTRVGLKRPVFLQTYSWTQTSCAWPHQSGLSIVLSRWNGSVHAVVPFSDLDLLLCIVSYTRSSSLSACVPTDQTTNILTASELAQVSIFFREQRSLCAVARPSVCLSSVTFVRPTQAVVIFGTISMAFGTLAIRWHPRKFFLRRSFQGNPSVGGVKHNRGSQI